MCTNFSFAQEAGKLRMGLEGGILFPLEESDGVFLKKAMELKYNLQNNMNIGIKAESTSFWKTKSYIANLLSFFATYDYYFHSEGNLFSPFIGAGLGYYFCKADDYYYYPHDYLKRKTNNPTFFIRTGFEYWKLRTSLAYNLVRNPNEISPEGKNNDYVSLTIGFYIGGGKWK